MENKFKITSKLEKSLDDVKLEDDGSLILEGIASTTSMDLEGDTISRDCINSMKSQALSCNIHGDHMIGLDDVIGTVKDVLKSDDDTLKVKFIIIPSIAPMIKEKLDCGVNLGLSIRGTVEDFNETSDGWEINRINLIEISLTALPANWDTMGTITTSKGLVISKCLSGACRQLRKNKEYEMELEEEMTNNKDEKIEHSLNEEDLVNLFKELSEPLRDEIKEVVKSELKQEISEEAKIEIRDEITDELQNSIKNDISNELKVDVVDEVINEVKDELVESKNEDENDKEADDSEIENNDETIIDSTKSLDDEIKEEEINEDLIEEDEILSEEDIPEIESNPKHSEFKKYEHPPEVKADINVRRLTRNIEKNVEEKILKDLGVNREPVSETEKFIKNWVKEEETPKIDKCKTMSRKEIVERMKNTSQSSSPFFRALKEMQEEE